MQTKTGKVRWTIEEDSYIADNSYGETDNELAINLGRTAKSVAMRKYRLRKKETLETKWTKLGTLISDYPAKDKPCKKQIMKIQPSDDGATFLHPYDVRLKTLEEKVENIFSIIYWNNHGIWSKIMKFLYNNLSWYYCAVLSIFLIVMIIRKLKLVAAGLTW
jgi:hypothetical protein